MNSVRVQIKKDALRLTLTVAIKNLEADREKCLNVLGYMAKESRIKPIFGRTYEPMKEGTLAYKNDIYKTQLDKYDRLLNLCHDVGLDTISITLPDYEYIIGWRDYKHTYIYIVYLDWIKVKIKNACMFAKYPSFDTVSQEFNIMKIKQR